MTMSTKHASKHVTRSPKRKPKPKRPPAPVRAPFLGDLITKAVLPALAKTYEANITTTGDNIITATCSTANVDAVGDSITVAGWQTSDYMENPVVLFGHDYRQPPIGRALAVWKTPTALRARIEFAPASVSAFAHQIYQLVKSKFINSVSVGFRVVRQTANRHGGHDIHEARLVEISICPIPALSQARIDQRAVAAKMKKWLGGRGDREIVFSLVDDTPELRRRRAAREAAERRELAAVIHATLKRGLNLK